RAGAHLTGDRDDRDGVHVRVRERRDEVRRAGPGRGHADADLPGGRGVTGRGVAGALLVAHEDVAQARGVEERVVGGQDRAARDPEDDLRADLLERPHDRRRPVDLLDDGGLGARRCERWPRRGAGRRGDWSLGHGDPPGTSVVVRQIGNKKPSDPGWVRRVARNGPTRVSAAARLDKYDDLLHGETVTPRGAAAAHRLTSWILVPHTGRWRRRRAAADGGARCGGIHGPCAPFTPPRPEAPRSSPSSTFPSTRPGPVRSRPRSPPPGSTSSTPTAAAGCTRWSSRTSSAPRGPAASSRSATASPSSPSATTSRGPPHPAATPSGSTCRPRRRSRSPRGSTSTPPPPSPSRASPP